MALGVGLCNNGFMHHGNASTLLPPASEMNSCFSHISLPRLCHTCCVGDLQTFLQVVLEQPSSQHMAKPGALQGKPLAGSYGKP